jgi:hypothetical protein
LRCAFTLPRYRQSSRRVGLTGRNFQLRDEGLPVVSLRRSPHPLFRSGFGVTWVSPSISFRSDTGLTKTAIAFYSDFPSKKRLNLKRSMIKRRWTKPAWSSLGVMACR